MALAMERSPRRGLGPSPEGVAKIGLRHLPSAASRWPPGSLQGVGGAADLACAGDLFLLAIYH